MSDGPGRDPGQIAAWIRALSSVCTHMGCTLHFRPDWEDLRCPCHDASLRINVEDGVIFVWTAQA